MRRSVCETTSAHQLLPMLVAQWPMFRKCCCTVYPKKYAHGFCFAVLCCGYTLTDYPISIRLTSLALWQSNDCPSASKATLMNMDKYFMWIHYERLHNHNKAKHNKTVCIFLGIYCMKMFWTTAKMLNIVLQMLVRRTWVSCCRLQGSSDWNKYCRSLFWLPYWLRLWRSP